MGARRLGLTSHEIRLRNFIRPEEMPYTTPSGCVYDRGDYIQALKKAMELIDYESWVREKENAARQGRYIGIGFGATIDSGSNNFG